MMSKGISYEIKEERIKSTKLQLIIKGWKSYNAIQISLKKLIITLK